MNSTKLRKVTEARHATDSATDAMLNALRSGEKNGSVGSKSPVRSRVTPPKTNMEPENGPLEKEIPIGNHHFQVPC